MRREGLSVEDVEKVTMRLEMGMDNPELQEDPQRPSDGSFW